MVKLQKSRIKKTALDRVSILEQEAQKTKNEKLSKRYVHLARRIAMKANISVPRSLKRQYCKHCYTFWRFGTNVRVRLQKNKKLVMTCLACRKFTRIPFEDKKVISRKKSIVSKIQRPQ